MTLYRYNFGVPTPYDEGPRVFIEADDIDHGFEILRRLQEHDSLSGVDPAPRAGDLIYREDLTIQRPIAWDLHEGSSSRGTWEIVATPVARKPDA